VTFEPSRAKILRELEPTAPAPGQAGSPQLVSSSALMWSSQAISSSPGIGGTAVREPVPISIRLLQRLAVDPHGPRARSVA